jgi:alpha-D-xyloside xylohydrolase
MARAAEKKWDELEIRVYPGADADFILYEDEGDNYNYEKGSYTEIVFHWDDHARKLTIGERKGGFPGMLNSRKFNIVLVNEKKATGSGNTLEFNGSVVYKGKQAVISL